MKKFWVYVHVCPNGKKYVGCTTQARPERRWREGRGYYQNKHFYSAIKKYGWNNIKHEAWELTCESEMYYAEKYLIAYYHTTESKYGYNHSIGGEKSALGCTSSKEYREKRSESLKKRWSDPEYRKRISEAVKERCSDPEVQRKRSEIQKKVHSDPEYRKRISETLKGISRSKETRKRIAEAKKGKPLPRVKIKLQDGTIVEVTKQTLTRWYVNKGKKFEYLSY